MAINMFQATVTGTAAILVTVPPGTGSVTIINNQGTNTIAIGTTSGVTTSNGGILPANGSITFPGYPTSSATTLWAVANTGSNVVSVVLSTAK
jgi:hypothetical protein